MTGKTDWIGRVGAEWADKADAMDALLGPVGRTGLIALGAMSGKRVLDLGCGAGDSAIALAEMGASVTGLDVSPDLIARAQTRSTDVEWVLADAANARFSKPFDALYSRFGAMFFDDPIAAFAHLRTQMTPGADLCVVCWRPAAENGWVTVPLHAAQPILGVARTQLPPDGGAGPFGWARPDIFEPILSGAGWSDITWTPVQAPAVLAHGDADSPERRAADFCMRIGVLASRLAQSSQDERRAVGLALQTYFADFVVNDAVTVPTAAWIIKAKA